MERCETCSVIRPFSSPESPFLFVTWSVVDDIFRRVALGARIHPTYSANLRSANRALSKHAQQQRSSAENLQKSDFAGKSNIGELRSQYLEIRSIRSIINLRQPSIAFVKIRIIWKNRVRTPKEIRLVR